jgi:ribose-phosphate pyrophosphokinase
MTMMAITPAPLARLFGELDFSPTPHRQELAITLKQWTAARGAAFAPPADAIARAMSQGSLRAGFIVRPAADGRDYIVALGRDAAERLLGPLDADGRLARAKHRRIAARLRRLFDEARRTGTPFVAQFDHPERSLKNATADVLVAPLSEDAKTVSAVLVAATLRRYHVAAPVRPSPRELSPQFSLFALGASRPLGERIAAALDGPLAPVEERDFEDGEFKIRPLSNVRGHDVYVVSSLHGDDEATSADKLCRLLFFVGALKEAAAARVTAVTPYLCYQRKDRQTKPRDPVTSRYVAQLLEAMGTDRVIAVDAHNVAAFQNAFRCDTEHLDAHAVFARHCVDLIGDAPVAVVSPDLGGEKRAELFRERLEHMLRRPVAKAFMDKRRSEGKVTGDIFAGDVEGRIAVVLDDLISGGGTMARVARACRGRGATQVWCAATHGLFSPGSVATLREAPIDRIIVTDTTPLPYFMSEAPLAGRLTILGVAPLLSRALRCCHTGGSIVRLLEQGP